MKADRLSWGNLTIVREWREDVRLPDGRGGEYVAEEGSGERMLRLKCDCGYAWDLRWADFPGRAILRDCGRRECPHVQARLKFYRLDPNGDPSMLGRPDDPLPLYGRGKRGRPRTAAPRYTFLLSMSEQEYKDLLWGLGETGETKSSFVRNAIKNRIRELKELQNA